MLKKLAEYIVGLNKAPMVTDAKGREYIKSDDYEYIENRCKVLNDNLSSSTLESIVDYVRDNVAKGTAGEKLLIHIESPTDVKLYSDIHGIDTRNEATRTTLIRSEAIIPRRKVDRFMKSEEFVIELLSNYEQNHNRDTIIKLVSNIVTDSSVQTSDDGFSQKVQAKTGVATVENIEIENPFELIPFRSFPEIDQQLSMFIFRIDENGNPAIFEGGDTYWRINSMNLIKEYFKRELGDTVKIVS